MLNIKKKGINKKVDNKKSQMEKSATEFNLIDAGYTSKYITKMHPGIDIQAQRVLLHLLYSVRNDLALDHICYLHME